jgi:hypothetical protein
VTLRSISNQMHPSLGSIKRRGRLLGHLLINLTVAGGPPNSLTETGHRCSPVPGAQSVKDVSVILHNNSFGVVSIPAAALQVASLGAPTSIRARSVGSTSFRTLKATCLKCWILSTRSLNPQAFGYFLPPASEASDCCFSISYSGPSPLV